MLTIIFLFIVIQRLLELYVAKKNAIYIESLGGFEIGRSTYSVIVLLHISFLFSLLIEGSIFSYGMPSYWLIFFGVFVLLQALRFWIILSLGRFWNTRIYILPNSRPIKKGPYKYVRHPNYLVVMLEMVTISILFGAYYTAIIFPIINAAILRRRIELEEKALTELTFYEKEMDTIPKFFPNTKR